MIVMYTEEKLSNQILAPISFSRPTLHEPYNEGIKDNEDLYNETKWVCLIFN